MNSEWFHWLSRITAAYAALLPPQPLLHYMALLTPSPPTSYRLFNPNLLAGKSLVVSRTKELRDAVVATEVGGTR